jgi:DMSO/TMAO reductase YedYZ molybdopterin-dependent catalytic subunit
MAGVSPDMVGAGWRLELVNGLRTATLTRSDLAAMPQHVESLPIACVEGWSAGATWTGVRVRDLLALVGADPGDGAAVTVTSLQQRYAFGTSVLQSNFAADHKTLLALEINGETLSLDHGYPARLIAPNRPGVLQTKWVTRMEVSA